MRVYDETMNSMKVSWDAALGATSYLLLYRSINATEPQQEGEVTPRRTQTPTHILSSMITSSEANTAVVCVL